MSGYHGFSKSNNAIQAEREDRYPASRIAKILRIPTKFVEQECGFASGGEWHHTSKFYNLTSYYDLALIEDWKNGEREGCSEDFATALAEWKARQAPTTIQRYEECSGEYLEWSGTRNYRTARKITFENLTVVRKGDWFTFPDGMRKRWDTGGFEIKNAAGKQLNTAKPVII